MNKCTTTDLRKKEIINLCDGSRLGFSSDFEFDVCTAQITGIIVEKTTGFLGLCRNESLIIPWCKIECIGEDTILVRLSTDETSMFTNCKKGSVF